MPKFFVKQEQINGDIIIIQGQDVNHIKKVLRAKIGDELQICNSQNGENFLCDIKEIENEKILCKIKQEIEKEFRKKEPNKYMPAYCIPTKEVIKYFDLDI